MLFIGMSQNHSAAAATFPEYSTTLLSNDLMLAIGMSEVLASGTLTSNVAHRSGMAKSGGRTDRMVWKSINSSAAKAKSIPKQA